METGNMTVDDRQTKPRQIAVIRSYDDLHRGLRDRSSELGMTRADLDAKAGLADGHAGKLLGQRQVKRFGNLTLGLVMGALKVALVMVEDSDIVAPPAEHTDASHSMRATPGSGSRWRFPKGPDFARSMGARRVHKQTPEQRSAAARKAAQARWHRPSVTD
jgi:hypothetical protein